MIDKIQLLIFTRFPTPGRAKTRLAAAIGAEAAARWQRRLTETTLATARTFLAANPEQGACEICFTGAPLAAFRAWLGPDLRYRRQVSGDLGRRLGRAIVQAAAGGGRRQPADEPKGLLVIGADAPDLTVQHLEQASAALQNHDLVLGPAHDGGYYLLGLRRPQPELFQGIAWGGGQVLAQTRASARRLGLRVALLPPLADIDRPDDLPQLAGDSRFADLFPAVPTLSVIIPTLNEAAWLEQTISALRDRAERATALEIVVADGGSRDATGPIARRAGVTLIDCPPGRGGQQNAGAAAATGRRLLFLHADTLPPPAYDTLVHQALDDPATVAGAFSLQIAAPGVGLRLIERGANLRARLWGLPYGDQGIFLEKRIFNEFGGFPPLPLLEDFALVRRLGRRGRIAILPQAVQTAARRWQRLGLWHTWLRNQWLVAAFMAGVDPAKLAALYRRHQP